MHKVMMWTMAMAMANLGAVGCAPQDYQPGDEEEGAEVGEVLTAPLNQAIVNGALSCMGVRTGRLTVLTAAHCVDDQQIVTVTIFGSGKTISGVAAVPDTYGAADRHHITLAEAQHDVAKITLDEEPESETYSSISTKTRSGDTHFDFLERLAAANLTKRLNVPGSFLSNVDLAMADGEITPGTSGSAVTLAGKKTVIGLISSFAMGHTFIVRFDKNAAFVK